MSRRVARNRAAVPYPNSLVFSSSSERKAQGSRFKEEEKSGSSSATTTSPPPHPQEIIPVSSALPSPAPTASPPPHRVPPVSSAPQHDDSPTAHPETPRRDRPGVEPEPQSSPVDITPYKEGDDEDGEAALIRAYDVVGANTYELLGYNEDEEEEEQGEASDDDEEDIDDADSEEDRTNWTAADRKAFRIRTRVDAAKRAEGHRRAGGIKTQQAMERGWEDFRDKALANGEIEDDIVDEHSMLLYIQYSAERPKRTRKGVDIPGTFVGASQLKKLFFGALRIRKVQDAANPSLALTRPAVSVFVYDAIKNRMDEALQRVQNGLVPEKDAPDIRANTWLTEVTDEQLERVGQGFLAHRHLRLAVFGHLAWTAQHASGNRGDDFRALRLAELQTKVLLHPDRWTAMTTILGLQGEEKAGRRGMRTLTPSKVINPVYTVFIPNLKPEMCPFGAFAFYFHYLHDEKEITKSMNIDWTVNKSWRAIRVLHGPRAPTTPFNEQNMYMSTPQRQRASAGSAAKPTWTYAPALLTRAILAAAGYRDDEPYDQIWSHVPVPEQFLKLVYPMAEEIVEKVAGKPNLYGTTNHWQMIIQLRPYLFHCGAAIFQKWPRSSIFRLPALAHPDVRNWMTHRYPSELAVLQANAGSPIDLECIQNTHLRVTLEEMRSLLAAQNLELKKVTRLLERRTAVFSPAQGFTASNYHTHALVMSEASTADEMAGPSTTTTFPSPRAPHMPQTSMTPQALFMEPPVASYYAEGAPQGIFPPLLRQKSVRWPDIFPLIKQPKLLWSKWGPRKSLEQFADIDELWSTYVEGHRNSTIRGIPPAVKSLPSSSWSSTFRQAGGRLTANQFVSSFGRHSARSHSLTGRDHCGLQAMRVAGGTAEFLKGLNWLQGELSKHRRQTASQPTESSSSQDSGSVLGPAFTLGSEDSEAPPRKRKTAIGARRRPAAGKKLKI
ncbi:hypothetical protein C8J57DRAFT_1216765 [Mycena rebaudengoi]|nr:hypothetical protein C8J57DRAFT_1216765 [Mycena rebaudengoi]